MAIEYESVKISKTIVNRVKANKKKTGIPISTFFEQAAEAKLADAKIYEDFHKTGKLKFKSNATR